MKICRKCGKDMEECKCEKPDPIEVCEQTGTRVDGCDCRKCRQRRRDLGHSDRRIKDMQDYPDDHDTDPFKSGAAIEFEADDDTDDLISKVENNEASINQAYGKIQDLEARIKELEAKVGK